MFTLSCGKCDAPVENTPLTGPFRVGREGDRKRVQLFYTDWLRAEINAVRIPRKLLLEIGSAEVRCSCGATPHQGAPLEVAAMWASPTTSASRCANRKCEKGPPAAGPRRRRVDGSR